MAVNNFGDHIQNHCILAVNMSYKEKNPLASYLCNCVAEVQRPVLGINRYVENSHKCNERQDLGLPEKKTKN